MTPVFHFSPLVGHPKAAKNAESGGRPTVILVEGSKGELELSQRIGDGTVDGWNPAPLRMMIIPLFIGF